MAFVIVCRAVIVMRRTNPELHRPFRTPLVPWVPLAGVAVNLAMMLSLGWESWLRLFAWLALYFAYGRRHSRLGRALLDEERRGGVSPGGRALP